LYSQVFENFFQLGGYVTKRKIRVELSEKELFSDLSNHAFRLYCVLKALIHYHGGGVNFTRAYLEEINKISAKKALEELLEKKIIKRVSRYSPEGYRICNELIICDTSIENLPSNIPPRALEKQIRSSPKDLGVPLADKRL